MQATRAALLTILLIPEILWGQQSSTGSAAREWTSSDGKKLTASYLGIQGEKVALKLANGKVSFLPASRFSAEDNSFIRANRFDYRQAWQAWPPSSMAAMALVPVTEDKSDTTHPGAFIYKTAHFRFISEVNLGTTLMKDLARVFELTYHLQAVSPLGTLAEPENKNGLFDAKLYGKRESYTQAGGPPNTAGVYRLKEKVFLAPLELMGVREGSAGWRKDSKYYDLSTIIHELTHMLTHGMLDNLPTWVNEGYAEYISNIPMERNAFMTGDEKIRDGVLDVLIKDSDILSGSRKPRVGVLSKADHINFIKSGARPDLFKVESVLPMSDAKWATGRNPIPGVTRMAGASLDDRLRLPKLYRTAHLILYYFIQIEGEKGAVKFRRFLEENQKNMSRYHQYLEDFKTYDTEMQAFLKLPGVARLDNNQIRYPSSLTPPKPPVAPFTDPDALKMGGIGQLLDGETAEVVGARIEAALVKDLGVNFQFRPVP